MSKLHLIPYYESAADFEAVQLLLPLQEAADFSDFQAWKDSIRVEELEAKDKDLSPVRFPIKAALLKEWSKESMLPITRSNLATFAQIHFKA